MGCAEERKKTKK